MYSYDIVCFICPTFLLYMFVIMCSPEEVPCDVGNETRWLTLEDVICSRSSNKSFSIFYTNNIYLCDFFHLSIGNESVINFEVICTFMSQCLRLTTLVDVNYCASLTSFTYIHVHRCFDGVNIIWRWAHLLFLIFVFGLLCGCLLGSSHRLFSKQILWCPHSTPILPLDCVWLLLDFPVNFRLDSGFISRSESVV